MSKFKVGDTLKVIDDRGSRAAAIGDIVTVIDVGGIKDTMLRVRSIASDVSYEMYDYRFELVTNKGDTPMARRTFKLLKELPDVRKGALFQERCDDGTQPYDLLTTDDYKGSNWDNKSRLGFSDRALLENQPAWFVEVFPVSPQYMTQPELDEYKAFMAARKKPAKRTSSRPVGRPKKTAKQ